MAAQFSTELPLTEPAATLVPDPAPAPSPPGPALRIPTLERSLQSLTGSGNHFFTGRCANRLPLRAAQRQRLAPPRKALELSNSCVQKGDPAHQPNGMCVSHCG
jgi:hypothetical protein